MNKYDKLKFQSENLLTNKYKCKKMFLKTVKCIFTKCKPTFGPPCIYESKYKLNKCCHSRWFTKALEAVEIYTELQKIFIGQNIINIECRVWNKIFLKNWNTENVMVKIIQV